ncbi:MAG: YbaB/EbfC family nucleoid-associated protein [Deinococcus sp.]|nr:YbaB/EbfC family nucleoid-associated protein [Deinococcus sp.]
MNLKKLLKQAQEAQAGMAKFQEELAAMRVSGAAGGGLVSATVSGQGELVGLRIDPSVADPKEVEMLEDLIVAAVAEARRKANEFAEGEMSKRFGGLVGGLGL